jgi:predicted 3-demethylubiquinone-9 3-methyltransferase (glyoxalase superfamily)
MMATLQKLALHLWFDYQAEEAAGYYTSIFNNSSIGRVSRYGKEGFEIHKMPEGTVLTVEFEIEGMQFIALNGGPLFQFNEAMSIMINCDNQAEIDYYWDKLSQGGDPAAQQCGWLKDKFGVSWQVSPVILNDMIADKDKEKSGRAMTAMLQMKKFDIEKLQKAYEG